MPRVPPNRVPGNQEARSTHQEERMSCLGVAAILATGLWLIWACVSDPRPEK